MEPDLEQKVTAYKELIFHLEHESKIKDELIQAQEEMLATLEGYNKELQKLIQEMLIG
jgi:hypothetical protein